MIIALSVIIAVLALGQDGSVQVRNGVLRRGDVVDFQVPIIPESVDGLEELLQDGDTIRLSGPGGSADDAMRMVEIIDLRNAVVEVRSACYSACALVFIASNRKNFPRDFTPIYFHSSPLTGLMLSKRNSDLYSDEDKVSISAQADRFLAFLDREEISPAIFDCSDRLGEIWIEEQGEGARPRIRSRYEFVWLNNEILGRNGVQGLPPHREPRPVEREFSIDPRRDESSVYWSTPEDCVTPERG